MISFDLVKYVLEAMRARKLRSWLTIVSILIGITAIFALVSFGNGMTNYVEDLSQKMGSDKLIIQPRGFGFGPPSLDSSVKLRERDLDFIRDVKGVDEATGVYVASVEAEFDDQKKYAYIFGSDLKENRELIAEVYSLNIATGKDLTGREKNKVVLGYNYQLPDKIFDKPLKVGDRILLNEQRMRIAGFYEAVGNPIDDANVYMNLDAFEELFNPSDFQFILARSSPGEDPAKLAETVQDKLADHRNQKKGAEDFFVQTFEQLVETFTSILAVINGVILLIALVSIFVAAVNITNMMYASTLERTREIGVMKAIGARNRDILFLFMLEAGLLGLIGGIIGVLLGYSLAAAAGKAVASAGFGILQPAFSIQLVVGCLLFAFLVGFFSGFLPAYQASKLKPVDALRYE